MDSLFDRSTDGSETVYGHGVILRAPTAPKERRLTGHEDGEGMRLPPTLAPLPGMNPSAVETFDFADIVHSDSVELFSLDDPAPVVGRRLPRTDTPGVPASVDPDVEVFPFEGSLQRPYPDSRGLAGIMPPIQAREAFPSPFGGAGFQAPPPIVESAPQLTPPPSSADPETVYFGHDSAEIDGRGRRILTEVAEEVKVTGTPLVVEGHASQAADVDTPSERDIVNLRKSMDRAYNVSTALIREGVPPEKIKTCAFGDNVPPGNPDGRTEPEAARRVEIHQGY